MDLRDVQAFVALAEQKHFARAAAVLGVSQPAFSARIKRLEEALRLPLVRRGTRFQGLTPEGARVLVWARAVQAGVASLDAEAQAVRGQLTGTMAIGVIPSALPMAGRLTAAITARHKALDVTLRSLSSEDIQRGLDDFTLDAAITYLDREPLSGVRTHLLYAEHYSVIVNKALAADLPDRSTIGWSNLAGWPLALLSPEMQCRRLLDAAFRQVGLNPRVVVTSDTFTPLISYAEAVPSAAIVPDQFVPLRLGPSLKVLKLGRPDISNGVGLVVRDAAPISAVVAAVWELAQRQFVP